MKLLSFPLIAILFIACNSENMNNESVEDKYIYLEEVEGKDAMEWVVDHNESTLDDLEQEETFEGDFERIKAIRNSKDRIIFPIVKGEFIYNFWKDEENPRGLLRRINQDKYNAGKDDWETVIDIDLLSEKEDKKWVYHGLSFLKPDYKIGMMSLSNGGTDANEIREFSTETMSFVENGFFVPEAKASITWKDENTLFVQSNFGPGTTTTSGYPRIVKEWKRGTKFEEAKVSFEIDSTDMGLWSGSYRDGERSHFYLLQMIDFYTSKIHVLVGDQWKQLEIPLSADLKGIFKNQALILLKKDWTLNDQTYLAGSLVSFDYDRFIEGDKELTLIYAANKNQSIEQVRTTKDFLVMNILDNVTGSIVKFAYVDNQWSSEKIDAPLNSTLNISVVNEKNNRFYYTADGYLAPTTLYYWEEGNSIIDQQLKASFDAEGLEVRQEWATSKDGEKIPYFLVCKEGVKMNGENPTMLYGYGGFEISLKPYYSGPIGAAWLEKGGIYVVANIRGGGEFGPRWHQAALKEKRQNAYNDFHAVAEQLISKGYTDSDHLAIQGGSNGGLLMGVMLTQRPDLYKAVICAVPLLDMKRYNHLLAGASWMGEYGNPDIPEEWEFIKQYSPYQNLKYDKDYPEVLFVTSTKDDRVHPGHARKMAAKMEGMGYAIHYYENIEGGHGAASTNDQIAYRDAIIYSFLNRFVVD